MTRHTDKRNNTLRDIEYLLALVVGMRMPDEECAVVVSSLMRISATKYRIQKGAHTMICEAIDALEGGVSEQAAESESK